MALGTNSYAVNGPFSTQHDIVHMINTCIRILETPGNQRTPFTKLQALRWLVHLTGDIHQPLHVSAGYYEFDDQDDALLIVDPARALELPQDRGGNLLFFGTGSSDELHAVWDNLLVRRIANTPNFNQLADFILSRLNDLTWMNQRRSMLSTPGEFHSWASRWATDSLFQARQAYQGIRIGKTTFDSDGDIVSIQIVFPDHYLDRHVERETLQVAKAGFRLAELLNRINWR